MEDGTLYYVRNGIWSIDGTKVTYTAETGEEKEGYVFANPGSISLPKCNTKHSYIIIEENRIILKEVNGNVIKEYEI